MLTALAVGFALAATVAVPVAAQAAPPTTISPVADRTSTGVTADALPTAQIDGVVWSQAIVGNTVYAGGSFANARPAGAPDGAQLTPRSNLLAYNLTTGALVAGFHPDVNGAVKTVVASPDGSRVYIGGSFTAIDGQYRYRLAAFSTATGALLPFAPGVDASVNSLSVTNSAVYAGGVFSMANGVARTRLAAFSTTGALLGWAPTAGDVVNAVLLTPDGKHVVVGGAFTTLNGSRALGLGSTDAVTGTSVPFAVNQVVQDYGPKSAILSLSTDGTAIYGTGYDAVGEHFEGTFSADPTTGAINWLEDCHGDTYGSYAGGGQVYVVSHEHTCSTVGGFPETSPRTWHGTTAFTTRATGTLAANTIKDYASFAGHPSPSMINWFPELSIGSYTRQYQAAWTVTGNGRYVVEGGEFLDVNGTPQQGLVRFAVPSIAPNKRGPMDTTSTPTAGGVSDTSITISWPANWDQDDDTLTYTLLRNGAPVFTTTAVSQFWHRPTLSFADTHLQPATDYSYTVVVADPDGNTVRTPPVQARTLGPTTVTGVPSPAAPVTGQRVTVRSTVAAAIPATGAPTGSVTVSVDGTARARTTLQHSVTTTTLAGLTVGRHTIALRYHGDAAHAPSSFSRVVTVAAGHSSTRITSSTAHPLAHRLVRFHAYVGAAAPAAGRPAGSVIFYLDGHPRATRTLHSGTATYSVRLSRGHHRIQVRYVGTSSYRASTSASLTRYAR